MKASASYILSILLVLIINTTLYAQPGYYNQQRTRTAYLAEWKAVENQNTRNNARTPSNTNTTPLTTWRSNQTAEKPVKLTPDQIAKQKKIDEEQAIDWEVWAKYHPEYSFKKDIAGMPKDYVEITYTSMATYAGAYKNGQFDGFGFYVYPKLKGSYKGDFVKGKKEGIGEEYFASGYRYIGEFKNDMYNGKAIVFADDNRNYYEGNFKDGERNGQGTEIDYMDGRYVGTWVANRKSGQGKWTKNGRLIYEGGYVNGLFEGEGTEYYDNGDKYVGSFVKRRRQGKGTMYKKDGTTQSGDWIDGDFKAAANTDGNITVLSVDGDSYTGSLKNELRDGEGTFTTKKGYKYTGTWKEGKQHGKGKSTYPNGDSFEGNYVNGSRNGKGVYTFADGGTCEASFDKTKFKAVSKYPNGGVYKGYICGHPWFDISAEYFRCKEGVMNYPDGSVYDGEWYLDKPFGKGTMKKADGTKIKSDNIQYLVY